MKKLLALIPSVLLFVLANPAQAGRIEPKPVSCYFFRGEQLEIQQTCIYDSHSWLGGGIATLQWEDGVKTSIAWGVQERGVKTCENTSLDGVCALSYHRDPETLNSISRAELDRMRRNGRKTLHCNQVGRNSVCIAPI